MEDIDLKNKNENEVETIYNDLATLYNKSDEKIKVLVKIKN